MKSQVIRPLLRRHRGTLLGMLSITIIVVLMGVAGTEIGRRIIDLVSQPVQAGKRGPSQLLLYGLSYLAIAVAGGAIAYGLNVIYARFSQVFINDIRMKLFKHLLRLPQEFFNANPLGQLINRIMNEAGTIGGFFARIFMQPMVNAVLIVFYGIYLVLLNGKLAIAGLLFIPLYLIILPKLNHRVQTLTAGSIDSYENLSSHFQEVFSGITDIRASQTYHYEEARLGSKIREHIRKNARMTQTMGGAESLINALMRLAPLPLYLLGGGLCLRGEMSAGTLVASIAVVTILYSQIIFMMSFLTEWRQVSVRLDRIEEYLRSEPERGVGPQAGRDDLAGGDIVVDKVQFGFAQDQPLLSDIHFVAEFGKRTAFVGPSGSGKSLTAALLGTIYKPLSGNISFGGRAVEATPLYHLRAGMGYVQQTLFLFQDTIRNNIIYALLKKPSGDGGDIETWIDFSSFDHIRGPEMLEQRLIEAIQGVGLYEDIVHLGLRSRSRWKPAEVTPAEKTEIVKARGELAKDISERYGDCVELYRGDRFLEYGTVLENIVFGPTAAVAEAFGSVRRFYKEHLEAILRKQGLADGFLSFGLHIAGANRLLFEKLDQAKSPLLDALESDREQRERRKKIGDRLDLHADRPMIMKKKDPSLYEEIMETALNHCPGRSKESFLDGKMRESILGLRRQVHRLLGDRAEGRMGFYEEGAFNEFMSFTDNVIFGNIDPTRRKAQEEILDLLRRKLREAGLEGLALKRGLEFDVGERGSRLSGGQRQKVVLARILLRNPSILILDEATASLDAASQARINDLVRKQHKEKTVISIVHRLDVIRDYDQILVFHKGRIVERGTFEELIKMGGMFASLHQGAME